MSNFFAIIFVLIYIIGFPYLVRFIGKKLLKLIKFLRGVINDLQRRTERGIQPTEEVIPVNEVQEGISQE